MATPPRPPGRRWSPAEAMADRLRQRILSGEVPDGGLLPKIDDLMAEFAVSRPAARQACAILETEGLLRVRRGHQGGAVVHLPGPGNAAYALAQVLEVRQVGVDDVAAAVARLEPLCAEMCAERTDRETAVLPVLRAAQAELATAIEQGRAVEASRAARRWHEALVDGCGNETSRALLGTLEAVWTSHARASAVDFASRGVPFSEASSRRVHAEHAQIERLIAAGDGPAAAEAARRHLGTARIHDDGAAGARDGAVRARHVRDALAGWPTG